jgi:hypothetical protein
MAGRRLDRDAKSILSRWAESGITGLGRCVRRLVRHGVPQGQRPRGSAGASSSRKISADIGAFVIFPGRDLARLIPDKDHEKNQKAKGASEGSEAAAG